MNVFIRQNMSLNVDRKANIMANCRQELNVFFIKIIAKIVQFAISPL